MKPAMPWLVLAVGLTSVLCGCTSSTRADGEKADRRVSRPEDFGAAGDGVKDDTKAIQAAIDYIASQPPELDGRRGTVLLNKVYFITRQKPVGDDTSPEHNLETGPHYRALHVPSGVTIAGDGTVTLLQRGVPSRQHQSSYTYAFWICADPDRAVRVDREHCAMDPAQHVSNVVIRDITVLNDPASLYPPFSETSALVLHCPIDVRVENVKMRHWHRGLKVMHPLRCTFQGNIIEDSRYFGIGIYSDGQKEPTEVRIISNTLRGNTFLSGGIYFAGSNFEVRDNTLSFTHGIFAEYAHDSLIADNRISRSPYGIRAGYLASGTASGLEIRGNQLSGCAAGIMVNNSSDVHVTENTLDGFIELGSDVLIEPPNGYWGFGRARVGINVEDSTNVHVAGNTVAGLSTGVPVGIRVSNSRFTTALDASPYVPTDKNDPPGNDYNTGNIVRDNRVAGSSGLRIGYYLENQKDYVLTNNASRNTSGSRVIGSTGRAEDNSFDGPLAVVAEAAVSCRRLILDGHPMHWAGVPAGPFKYAEPAPPENEYFPPPPTAKKGTTP